MSVVEETKNSLDSHPPQHFMYLLLWKEIKTILHFLPLPKIQCICCWEEKHKQIPSFTPTFYVPVVGKRNQNFIRFSPSPTFNVSVVGKWKQKWLRFTPTFYVPVVWKRSKNFLRFPPPQHLMYLLLGNITKHSLDSPQHYIYLFLGRGTTEQSFSYPPLLFCIPVCMTVPIGWLMSLELKYCNKFKASGPWDWKQNPIPLIKCFLPLNVNNII